MKGIVKSKTVFETTDGKMFKEKHEALEHQSKVDLSEALEKNPLFGSVNGSRVAADDLWVWIANYGDVVSGIVEVAKIARRIASIENDDKDDDEDDGDED